MTRMQFSGIASLSLLRVLLESLIALLPVFFPNFSIVKREVKIGLTVIAGVLLLYLVVTWVRSTQLFAASQSTYKVLFQDVSGLKTGDPVTVFGMPSGNVESIQLENQGAVVTITLDEGISVRNDAAAEIRVKELMGGKLIALTPGVAVGTWDRAKAINGTTTLDFSSAFAKAGEFMERFDMDQIDSLVANINKIASSFASVAEEIDSMDTGALLDDINQSADRLNSILGKVEQREIVKKIDNSLVKIDHLAENADRTLNSFGNLADKVSDRTLPAVDSVLAQIDDMLDEAEDMVVVLKDLMNQMQDQRTVAGKLLYDPQLAEDLDFTMDNLNQTLDHLRTKKIHVRMSLSKKPRLFEEKVEGEE